MRVYWKRIILGIIFTCLVTLGCFLYNEVRYILKHRPVVSQASLRAEILHSLSNPFPQADSLILNTRWGFCGNSDPDELPIVFDTQLETEGSKKDLSARLKIPVVSMTDFNKVMDTIRKYRFHGEFVISLWDSCRSRKVSAEIHAEQLSTRKVRVYENYLYGDTSKFISRDFTLEKDKWAYRITDTSAQVIR